MHNRPNRVRQIRRHQAGPREAQRAFQKFDPAWIVGQRIGCLAWSIADASPDQDLAQARHLPKFVAAFSEQVEQLRYLSGANAFMELPISVLEICSGENFEKKAPAAALTVGQVRNLLEWYKTPRKAQFVDQAGREFKISKAPPVEAADIIAQMILFSDLPAVSIVQALCFFVDPEFDHNHSDPIGMARLQLFLDNARSPAYRTLDVAAAVHNYASIFRIANARIDYAAIIKNALLDALLAWPLLVFKRSHRPGREKLLSSFSLPVVVDLSFDGKQSVTMEFGRGYVPPHGILEELRRQMEAALTTAKGLWRSKNGHVLDRWDQVRGASCTIDLRLAAEICRETPLKPIWQDRSAEAYFVQVFLAKLIGRHVSMTAGISGTVEEPLPEMKRRELADPLLKDFSIMTQDAALTQRFVAARKAAQTDRSTAFEPTGHASKDKLMGKVSGQVAKYRFARASKKYRKLILPRTSKISGADEAGAGYIEVNYVHSQGIAADAAQLGGWRQHNYSRCPDIGHLIHRDPDLLPPLHHAFVRETQEALRRSEDQLVKLDASHSILSVAALLAHLNFEYRFQRKPLATSLSWSMMRAIPGETDSRFWHMLLKTLGASDLAIKEHFLRGDANYTALLIQSILNGGVESQELGCTAPPDIVVVFDAHHLWREGLSEIDRKELRFDAGAMIDAVNALSINELRDPYREKIGGGRIIFVDSGVKYMNTPYFHALGPDDEFRSELFAALSIFDHGFTLQMARNVVGDLAENILHLKSILQEFVKEGFLWRHGEYYFLPHALRAEAPRPSLALAKLHKRIANSLMPGIGEASSSGIATAECFEVEMGRSAQAYMSKAITIIGEATPLPENKDDFGALEDLRRTISCEQDLQLRFFELPTWGVLTRLNKNPIPAFRSETLHYADHLLQRAEKTGGLTPHGYTNYIRAAENALYAAWRAKDLPAAEALIRRIDEVFVEAEAIADAYSDPDEQKDWLVHVLTWRRRYLGNFFAHDKGALGRKFPRWAPGECDELDRRILEICDGETQFGVFPDIFWFIRYGDSLSDDDAASQFYRKALFFSPALLETYPRIFGSMSRTDYRRLMLGEPGQAFWKQKVAGAIDWVRLNESRLARRPISRVGKERIAKGYNEMLRYVGA